MYLLSWTIFSLKASKQSVSYTNFWHNELSLRGIKLDWFQPKNIPVYLLTWPLFCFCDNLIVHTRTCTSIYTNTDTHLRGSLLIVSVRGNELPSCLKCALQWPRARAVHVAIRERGGGSLLEHSTDSGDARIGVDSMRFATIEVTVIAIELLTRSPSPMIDDIVLSSALAATR